MDLRTKSGLHIKINFVQKMAALKRFFGCFCVPPFRKDFYFTEGFLAICFVLLFAQLGSAGRCPAEPAYDRALNAQKSLIYQRFRVLYRYAYFAILRKNTVILSDRITVTSAIAVL